MNPGRPVRALWTLTGALTLAASLAGLQSPGIYRGVVAAQLLPGAVSQDLMSAVAGVALPVLALTARRGHTKVRVVALGILGYLFYAYGIYSIERTYNGFYLVYLAIFALSFWGMVFTALHLWKLELNPGGGAARLNRTRQPLTQDAGAGHGAVTGPEK